MYLRHLDAEQRDEAVAESVALAWKQYRRLCEKGEKDPAKMNCPLTDYSCRQVIPPSGNRATHSYAA